MGTGRRLILGIVVLLGLISVWSLTVTSVAVNGTDSQNWMLQWLNNPTTYNITAQADGYANWTVKVTNGTYTYTFCDWQTDSNYVNKTQIACIVNLSTIWTNLAEGNYNLTVIAINVSNSLDNDTKTFELFGKDITAPTVSASPASQTWTNQNIFVSLTASDGLSGVETLYYTRVTYSSTCPTQGDASYTSVVGSSVTVTISDEGEWKICVYARDNAGNTGTISEFGPYQLDKTNPSISIVSPTGYISNYPSRVQANVQDSLSGVSNANVSISCVRDSTTYYLGSDGNFVGAEYWFTLIYNATSGYWETGLPSGNFWNTCGEGNYTIKIRGVDNAGNIETVENWFIVDLTDPVLNELNYSADSVYIDENNHNWTAGNIYFWVNASDNNGVSSVEVLLNTTTVTLTYNSTSGLWEGSIDTTGLSDGFYEIRVRITDVAGRAYNNVEGNLSVDNTAPTISISMQDEDGNTVNSGDYVNKNVSVTIQANDTGVGVNVTRYRINSGDWENYIDTLNFSEEGQYTIDVYTEDYLGNSATQQVTFTIDKTAPEIIEIIVPTVVKNGTTITIKANLSDNFGIQTVTVDASDLGAGTVTLNYNSTSGLYEGSLTVNATGDFIANLTLTVTDNAGNSNSTEFTIEVDNTAPSLVSAKVIGPRYILVRTSEDVYDTEDPENFVNNFQISGITVEDVEIINRTAFKVKVNETPVGTVSVTMSGKDLAGNTFTDSVQIENTADFLWILQGSGWHFIAFDRIVDIDWSILKQALETELGQGATILTYNGKWNQVTTFDNPLKGFAVYVNTTNYALIPVKFRDYEAKSLELSKGWNLISVVDSSTSVNSFDSTAIGQSSLVSLMVNGNPAFSWIYDTNGNLVVSNNFGSLNFVSNINETTAYWIYLPQAVTYTAPWTPNP